MPTDYQVVFHGDVEQGVTLQEIKSNLCKLFQAPPEAIQKKFFSGSLPVLVKENVTHDLATKYVSALKKAGLMASVEGDPDR